jgi:uncharacterized membrane protein YedE/YeeE
MTLAGKPSAPAGLSATSGPDWRIAGLAVILLLGGIAYIGGAVGGKPAMLYTLGASLGLVLFHAAFGFASTWRAFLADGRGAGLRAQMLMLALATAIFLPVLAQGTLFGQPAGGALAPFGTSVLVGAFLFGIGMQLGGGCASGTLYTVGGGSGRMVVTLIFFIAGSLLGTAHMPWWTQTPNLGTISLVSELGLSAALATQLGAFALIAAVTMVVEKRRHGRLDHGGAGLAGPGGGTGFTARLWRGPWPLLIGAIALALLNVATLALAGHPWTVSFGYALWGAKIAGAMGADVAAWAFWTWPYPRQALAGSVFAETTSVMNFGIVIGAFLAAGLAGKFGPLRRLDWGAMAAAAVGGMLMGYGARLAYGCNVGAYFSGIASGSLHGWLWFIAALAGTYVGTVLRPRFWLMVERRRVAAA